MGSSLPVTELFDFSESEEHRVVPSYPLESGTTGNVEQLSYRIMILHKLLSYQEGATTLCMCLEPEFNPLPGKMIYSLLAV